MAYVRKTRDEYTIESNHGYGWDEVCTEETWKDARERLKEYRTNETHAQHRIIKRRIKNEG